MDPDFQYGTGFEIFQNTVLIFLSRIKIDTVRCGTNGTVIRYKKIKINGKFLPVDGR